MGETGTAAQLMADQNESIAQTYNRERKQLLKFIRKRIADPEEAEDILQDVFYQLVDAYRLMKPIEKMTAWLFTVARNKITDRYRKKKPEPMSKLKGSSGQNNKEFLYLEDILPDLGDTPDTEMMKELIWKELEEALEDMPEKQRQVFVWHEFEDKSFKEMAEMTGETVNTLLSRKRYAVLFLRERLRELYEELF